VQLDQMALREQLALKEQQETPVQRVQQEKLVILAQLELAQQVLQA
jgi:hypothetical protein